MSNEKKKRIRSQYHEKLSRVTAGRLDRLETIAAYYLAGKPIRSIAQLVGRSRAQICRDLQLIREQWAKQFGESIRKLVDKELARIDRIEAEAWRAWERSQQPQIERLKERTSSSEDVTIKTAKRARQASGEQGYLSIMLSCTNARIKLFEFMARDNAGDRDDIIVEAVEVIVQNREEAEQMLTFEQFRDMAKITKKGD